MKTDCDECNYMIDFEDEDDWGSCCGVCGRLKEDLIKYLNEEGVYNV